MQMYACGEAAPSERARVRACVCAESLRCAALRKPEARREAADVRGATQAATAVRLAGGLSCESPCLCGADALAGGGPARAARACVCASRQRRTLSPFLQRTYKTHRLGKGEPAVRLALLTVGRVERQLTHRPVRLRDERL